MDIAELIATTARSHMESLRAGYAAGRAEQASAPPDSPDEYRSSVELVERREAYLEQVVYGLLNHPEPGKELSLITEAIDDACWVPSESYLERFPSEREVANERAAWLRELRHAIARGSDAAAGRLLRQAVERYARKVAEERVGS